MPGRRLFWLITLLVFLVPPSFGGQAAAAHHSAAPAVTSDCADNHAPPPPCPDEGTARHVAGDCCPLMSGAMALLPDAAADQRRAIPPGATASVARDLTGLSPTKDPPPPRA